MNKTVIIGIAAVAIIGVAIFAVTSMPTQTSPANQPAQQDPNETAPQMKESSDSEPDGEDMSYADGVYEATGSYTSPAGPEEIEVSVTLTDGIITDTSFTGLAENEISVQHQEDFAQGYQDLVIGRSIEEVSLDTVAGSSLTPEGFNDALEQIKTDASTAV